MPRITKYEVPRYCLEELFTYQSEHLLGVEFSNAWTTIRNGTITIQPGYVWDGCTPAWYIPMVGWFGVPEGSLDKSGKSQAYYASLVHDALCQFRKDIPIAKKATVKLFKDMLLERDFHLCRATLYAKCVDMFGPQNWLGYAPVAIVQA